MSKGYKLTGEHKKKISKNNGKYWIIFFQSLLVERYGYKPF